MKVQHLTTVDGFIAYDLDGARISAGGTRFAPDVTEAEAALLARAMTYKFGVLKREVGGAKGAVRGALEDKPDLMKRYCEEIRPLVRSGRPHRRPESRLLGVEADLECSVRIFRSSPHNIDRPLAIAPRS